MDGDHHSTTETLYRYVITMVGVFGVTAHYLNTGVKVMVTKSAPTR